MTSPLAPHPPLTDYYDQPERREQYVREIFDETAPWYDWATRFLSFGSGDWYRREALRRIGLAPGMKLLDLASGTGVVARAAAEVTGDARAIVTMDASLGMLRSGRTSSPKVQCPAESLSVRDAMFDRLTIGFALRHFADLSTVFDECHRVLKPGGKLLILEITAPDSRFARAMLGMYMGRFAPAVIGLRTRSAKAAELFRYYWETTRDCVRPDVILAALRAAGFTEVTRRRELGIFSEYSGVRRP
ncbi:MAG TPA: class I SAM-dependent methyltransferase [Thermoanaerobaculia bacterium]|nr:class I SAM-dependent methyltransferase [Thermoanaerobaculia bacterium]